MTTPLTPDVVMLVRMPKAAADNLTRTAPRIGLTPGALLTRLAEEVSVDSSGNLTLDAVEEPPNEV